MNYEAFSNYRKYMHEDSAYSLFSAIDSEIVIEQCMIKDYRLIAIFDAVNNYGGMSIRVRYINECWYLYQWSVGTWFWEKLTRENDVFIVELYNAFTAAGLIKTTLF